MEDPDPEKFNRIPKIELSPVEQAEDLALQGMELLENGDLELDDLEKIEELGQRALKLDPECLWAIRTLLAITPPGPRYGRLIQKGIRLSEKKFDREFEKEWEGSYYQMLHTRPYIYFLHGKFKIH